MSELGPTALTARARKLLTVLNAMLKTAHWPALAQDAKTIWNLAASGR
ncbi:MAG: hypothetical protein H0W34_07570 [Pyrinomonadaceae bacterium]|nr:hypothetical protein [Pyrinomonadaceae bacterium]